MRRKRPQDSFKHAGEGILHCFRTQRHMQFHFFMLVLVLFSGLLLALPTQQMLILLFCISLVIATEMVNTAVETIVDMVTQNYHPMAKLAKDVAAGAVLIASANATIAGALIFFGSQKIQTIRAGIREYRPDVTIVLVVGIMVLTITVIMSKLLTGRSNLGLWRGGVVSGHSAIGFFLAMTIIFSTGDIIVAILALLMAVIIAQSRVDAGIHSVQEVILGAVVAIFLTSSVYWLMPYVRANLLSGQNPTRTALRVEREVIFGHQPQTPHRTRLRS